MCEPNNPKIQLNCDQVCEIMIAFERYNERVKNISQRSPRVLKAMKFVALMEIMDILEASFKDNQTAGNALHELYDFNSLRGF